MVTAPSKPRGTALSAVEVNNVATSPWAKPDGRVDSETTCQAKLGLLALNSVEEVSLGATRGSGPNSERDVIHTRRTGKVRVFR